MEFLILILLFIGFRILVSIGSNSKSKSTSTYSGANGNKYFGPLQIKLFPEKVKNFELQRIKIRGRMPVPRRMRLSFTISILDVTQGKGNYKPVFSFIDDLQEPNSRCFQQRGNFGMTEVGDSVVDWLPIGALVPDIIQTAYSGKRNLEIILRLYNTDNPIELHGGFGGDGGELVHIATLKYHHDSNEIGYEEEIENRELAQALSLKIGVAVAMADGSLGDDEGNKLKSWIKNEISGYSSENYQQELKEKLNNAFREGYREISYGKLTLFNYLEQLNEVGSKKDKNEAISLCMDIMAADGVADKAELKMINDIASKLDLNMEEVERRRDAVTLNLEVNESDEDDLETFVGLKEEWSISQKKLHLSKEFQKWNNRMNALDSGVEREKAQQILDAIAKLRKKYG